MSVCSRFPNCDPTVQYLEKLSSLSPPVILTLPSTIRDFGVVTYSELSLEII